MDARFVDPLTNATMVSANTEFPERVENDRKE